MLHDEYVKRGPPMKAFAALHARGDAPVTLATRYTGDTLYVSYKQRQNAYTGGHDVPRG